MASTDGVPIKTLETAKEMISLLIELEGARVSEVAEHLDKPTSTTHDYLRTLENLGYVVHDDEEYYVSSLYLSIGTKVRAQDDLYAAAKSEMDSLSAEIDERLLLMEEEKGYGIVVYSTGKDDSLRVNPRPGGRTLLHAGAAGKAILSHLPRERVESILEDPGMDELTENTITDRQALFDELETVRERGYALDWEEGVVGIRGIGVPVAIDRLRSVGAVMAYGPANRFTEERLTEELPEKLLQLKNVLEFNLTYSEYE